MDRSRERLGHGPQHRGGGARAVGPPFPRIYYDRRALEPAKRFRHERLHAKCVVIDSAQAFVSSANFTMQAQERNIEVGVLLHDPHFAEHLARQWLGLIEAGHVAEWVPAAAGLSRSE